jgi:hypothetical protein
MSIQTGHPERCAGECADCAHKSRRNIDAPAALRTIARMRASLEVEDALDRRSA